MNSGGVHAQELLDQLEPGDAAAIERLMESISWPAGPVAAQGELEEAIQTGLDSLAKGKGCDGEAVFNRLEAEIDTTERKRLE